MSLCDQAMSSFDQCCNPTGVMFGTKLLPSGARPASEALAFDDSAEEIARAVTFGAMAGPVHQVGATVPLRRLRRIGRKGPVVKEEELPHADQAAEVEGEHEVVPAHPARHRRQGFQIGEQVAHVGERHVLIGGVGKSGEEVLAPGRGSLPERGDEIRFAPLADAVAGVGRDVRHVEGAERGFQARARRRGAYDPPCPDRRRAWRGRTRSRRR